MAYLQWMLTSMSVKCLFVFVMFFLFIVNKKNKKINKNAITFDQLFGKQNINIVSKGFTLSHERFVFLYKNGLVLRYYYSQLSISRTIKGPTILFERAKVRLME